jgi:ABC-type nickel/cobalt efflux system permease component RcnA
MRSLSANRPKRTKSHRHTRHGCRPRAKPPCTPREKKVVSESTTPPAAQKLPAPPQRARVLRNQKYLLCFLIAQLTTQFSGATPPLLDSILVVCCDQQITPAIVLQICAWKFQVDKVEATRTHTHTHTHSTQHTAHKHAHTNTDTDTQATTMNRTISKSSKSSNLVMAMAEG